MHVHFCNTTAHHNRFSGLELRNPSQEKSAAGALGTLEKAGFNFLNPSYQRSSFYHHLHTLLRPKFFLQTVTFFYSTTMFSIQSSLIALAVVSTTLASPHAEVARRHVNSTETRSLERRVNGKFSYYLPEQVACGGSSEYNGHTFAWPLSTWGSGHCGEQVTITVGGKSITATCIDQCVGCPDNQLDLTPGLFKELAGGSLDAGIIYGTWTSGGGGGGQGQGCSRSQGKGRSGGQGKGRARS
ncbi:hypothetical protein DL96DRAFT_1279173 [Flagelloscypha sp. PMI_526]|nr:hypothetical protein DL96DRAFT_1279173 [Flagelloscypha sp. PMI_526]